jgi:hypothetical protein
MNNQRFKYFQVLQFKLLSKSILILMFGALMGCSLNSQSNVASPSPAEIQDVVVHSSFSPQVWTSPQWTVEEGVTPLQDSSQIGMGFVRPEDRFTIPSELPQNAEFFISSSEPLSLDLVVYAGQDSTFIITAILDYKQIPFTLDGQYGLLHEIQVKEGGYLYIPMQIDIHEPGAHDLLLVGFKDPYTRQWNHDARNLVFGCLQTGRRAVVVVDNNEQPVQNIVPDVLGESPPSAVEFGLRVAFANMPASFLDFSHPSEPKRQMKMTQYGKPGQEFKYQLWISNYHSPDDVVDFGIMKFVNFHQTSIDGRDLLVVHFDGRQEAIIEDSIILPSQPGVHEVQMVFVFDPYKSILKEEVLTPRIFSSSCLGVDVR